MGCSFFPWADLKPARSGLQKPGRAVSFPAFSHLPTGAKVLIIVLINF
jgi:hypothetical protein